jgi:glycosyltransferase involved in cell wall biosynthesis
MTLASYDWVVFLDADDVLESGAVQAFVETRRRTPHSISVVGAMGRMMGADGAWIAEAPIGRDGSVEAYTAADFVLRNRFPPVVLADRRILLSLGGFDPELNASEDRDMWIRAATVAPVLKVSRQLFRKRDHGANMSRQAVRQTQAIFRVLGKAAANSAIGARPGDFREAEAICLYQSARMHLAAGDRPEALRQCVRSLARCFWLRQAQAAGFPWGFRARFLAGALTVFFSLTKKDARPAESAPVP